MIQANELRIGNIVDRLDYYCKVISIDAKGIVLEPINYKGERFIEQKVKPINITESFLFYFGAKEWKHIRYRTFKLGILMIGSTDNMRTFEIIDLYMKPIKYVHELQNLYFSLTGKELKQLKQR
jgi:hypothetical protein